MLESCNDDYQLSEDKMDIINISAYKFLELSDLPSLKEILLSKALEYNLRGTILLSHEGINCFFAGSREAVDQYKHLISNTLGMGELPYKESISSAQPFRRMLVRLKKEIISMGVPEIQPHKFTAPRITAEELNQWYDEKRDFILLDTRNDYEVRLGTFENAMHLDIQTFRAFPEAIQNLDPSFKEKTFVTTCTGGIRCEKAGPYMLSIGFKNVYQLDGGMLRYLEKCGSAHWVGECFVFDHRTALDPNLQETKTTQCFTCRSPLLPAEQQDPRYVLGESCPYCA